MGRDHSWGGSTKARMHGRHHAASVPGCSSSTHTSMFATPYEGVVGSCAKLQRIYSSKPAGLPGIHQRRVLIGGSMGCICVALCLVHATGPQRSYLGSETASRSLLHACCPWLVLVIGRRQHPVHLSSLPFQDDLLAGLAVHGNPSRLRVALDRFLHHQGNFTVTFVGGSITVGESHDGLSMPQ